MTKAVINLLVLQRLLTLQSLPQGNGKVFPRRRRQRSKSLPLQMDSEVQVRAVFHIRCLGGRPVCKDNHGRGEKDRCSATDQDVAYDCIFGRDGKVYYYMKCVCRLHWTKMRWEQEEIDLLC